MSAPPPGTACPRCSRSRMPRRASAPPAGSGSCASAAAHGERRHRLGQQFPLLRLELAGLGRLKEGVVERRLTGQHPPAHLRHRLVGRRVEAVAVGRAAQRLDDLVVARLDRARALGEVAERPERLDLHRRQHREQRRALAQRGLGARQQVRRAVDVALPRAATIARSCTASSANVVSNVCSTRRNRYSSCEVKTGSMLSSSARRSLNAMSARTTEHTWRARTSVSGPVSPPSSASRSSAGRIARRPCRHRLVTRSASGRMSGSSMVRPSSASSSNASASATSCTASRSRRDRAWAACSMDRPRRASPARQREVAGVVVALVGLVQRGAQEPRERLHWSTDRARGACPVPWRAAEQLAGDEVLAHPVELPTTAS